MLDFLLLTPELIIAGAGLLLLVAGAFSTPRNYVRFFTKAAFGVLLAVLFALSQQWNEPTTLFGGLLLLNNFIVLSKMIVVLSAMLVIALLRGSARVQTWITFETLALMLFSLLGMLLMVSANHLLAFYVALELMSLSLYILAASNRDNLLSAEAGVKYFVLGALASGLFLFGCSLVYGFSGTIDFAKLAILYSHHTLSIGALLGVILILVALFFKMSAAPFHMWVPDVYQGAPTVVTAFFASAPKAAVLIITLRFLMQPLHGLVDQWQQITIAASVASMIVGAVAALRQTNIKRLLAYSSIGHVGYLLLGISSGSIAGVQAVLIYLLIYSVMVAGMFCAIMQLKRDAKPAEELDDFKGLATREPVMAAVISIFMFSMAGIPPFAGFFAKFYVFLAVMEKGFFWLAVLGVLSSVIAAFYYLKIIKLMYFDETKTPLDAFAVPFGHKFVIGITTLFTLFVFLYPTPLVQIAREAAFALGQ